MTVEIICADARGALAAMPDGSVHACITSPPYWGLRDYGIEPGVWGGDDGCEHAWGQDLTGDTRDDGFKVWANNARDGKAPPDAPRVTRSQGAFCCLCSAWRGSLGLEPTPALYVEHIVQVMREVRRVLRDDGTLWLNLGDSYAASRSGPCGENSTLNGSRHSPMESRRAKETAGRPNSRWRFEPWGLKPKDLVGIPWRVAFALQADGWWLRSDIVWSKPNPMPESVTDRPTRSHEYIFLLTKKARYYYDADAIREPQTGNAHSRGSEDGNAAYQEARGSHYGRKSPSTIVPGGRNRRSVWEIATQPYPKAHFATFPEKLVEPCILAGTSERGCCPECGAPWERMVEKDRRFESGSGKAGNLPIGKNGPNLQGGGETVDVRRGPVVDTTTVGWRPTCDHEGDPVPCRVLDPFAGSGTVGLVAERLGRHSILIDASEDYCQMARERTAQMGLMSTEAAP